MSLETSLEQGFRLRLAGERFCATIDDQILVDWIRVVLRCMVAAERRIGVHRAVFEKTWCGGLAVCQVHGPGDGGNVGRYFLERNDRSVRVAVARKDPKPRRLALQELVGGGIPA